MSTPERTPVLPPVISLPAQAMGVAGDLAVESLVDGLEFRGVDFAASPATGADVLDCSFDSCELDGVDLSRSRITGTTVASCTGAHWNLAHASVSNVSFEESRAGALDLYGGLCERVEFRACRLGYVNLRGSTLRNVAFVDCRIDELDLGDTQLERCAFPGTSIENLRCVGTRMTSVDLTGADLAGIAGVRGLAGAVLTDLQVTLLAPAMAGELGIRIEG